MKNKISASLMCADPFELKNVLKTLENNNIDFL